MRSVPEEERIASRARGEGPVTAVYRFLSLDVTIRSPSPAIAAAVDFVYGELRPFVPHSASATQPAQASAPTPADGRIDLEIRPAEEDPARLEILLDGRKVQDVGGLGDLLHQLDNELTVALELACPHLYFVHAAALADGCKVTLLVGDSGAGKSTTAYALAAAGCDYLSDELAPIEPGTGLVHTYARALVLKRPPPPPLALPEDSLRTEWTYHVRPTSLGARIAAGPLPLGRIVFVRYSPEHPGPVLRPLSAGEATMKLYQGALNQLAHPSLGLDDTIGLVRRAACFDLLAAEIGPTVDLLRSEAARGR